MDDNQMKVLKTLIVWVGIILIIFFTTSCKVYQIDASTLTEIEKQELTEKIRVSPTRYNIFTGLQFRQNGLWYGVPGWNNYWGDPWRYNGWGYNQFNNTPIIIHRNKRRNGNINNRPRNRSNRPRVQNERLNGNNRRNINTGRSTNRSSSSVRRPSSTPNRRSAPKAPTRTRRNN